MLDFSSALYLGLRHPTVTLARWSSLTTGLPAALAEPAAARAVAQGLAHLLGCEQTVVAPSTLHLFWDLCGMLADERYAFYLDSGAYPIARWGVERALARGAPVHPFPHHSVEILQRRIRRRRSYRPVVVADGLCGSCACKAPLQDYLALVNHHGGLLLLDDTQALGILGTSPRSDVPYGFGGGGSLRYQDLQAPTVLVISSLAKGFGAPLAVLGGAKEMVRRFLRHSNTRMHCSPPSSAALHAALRALQINIWVGGVLRQRLVQRVTHFRKGLAIAGLSAHGGLFPVQTLANLTPEQAIQMHKQLEQQNVRTVMRQDHNGQSRLTFVLTAFHTKLEIERAVELLKSLRYSHAGSYAHSQ